MIYKVLFSEQARDFFKKLDNSVKQIVAKKINQLSQDPKLGKPMTGELAGSWSLRTDKYRILYKIIHQELLILVVEMRHRKNVYDGSNPLKMNAGETKEIIFLLQNMAGNQNFTARAEIGEGKEIARINDSG